MPTDDERREVARRLRHSWANVPDKNPVRHQLRVLFEIYSAVGLADDDDADAIDLFDRLADLIEPEPERTCHDTDYSRESITCSECGEITMNTLYFVDLDGGYRTVKSHRPRFCSSCGVRVIGEEAGDAD